MLKDNAQNNLFSPEKLKVWFDWLAKNAAHVQDTKDVMKDEGIADLDIPDSVIAMLQCVVGIKSIVGPVALEKSKIEECVESLRNNQKEIADFFKNIQTNPSLIISLMQKLGRPMPLPVKDLLRALEEASKDTTPASINYRKALMSYLELMKLQQNQLIALMQDSIDAVAEQSTHCLSGFMGAWVQDFELRFVQLAKQDEYSKNIGKLINASVLVLKEQQLYKDHQGSR